MPNINRDINIEDVNYTIEMNKLPDFVVELNEQGPQGARGYTGNGIESYIKTSTVGLTDIYTITFTDGNTTTVGVENGRGIVSIIKTSTEGLMDTYTISYNDNTTSTFNVVNGEKGDTGNAATISVGTVTTGEPGTDANIVNSGTIYDAVLDFTIPRGDKGDKGDKGDTGATGNGVSGVSKISTVGLVNTYRMAFTDGTYFDYPVTNGANGTGSVADVLVNGTSVLDGDIAKVIVPTNNNQLTNGAGYITSSDVGNGTLTIQKNGTTIGTFTANQSGNSTVNIEADTVLTDDITVSKNSDDELQAIGVIDDNSGSAIKTWTGTKAQYDSIVTKDSTTLYWVTDSKIIYLGETPVGNFSGGRNVGELVTALLPLTDAGLHLLDGSRLSGDGIYKGFVEYVAELYAENPNANYFTTETAWQSSVSTYGSCGKFVYDSTSNTVRLPKVSDILQCTTDLNALGNLIEAGLPSMTTNTTGAHTHTRGTMNITGTWAPAGLDIGYNITPTGAFSNSTRASNNYLGHDAKSGNTPYINFNAANGWSGETSSNGNHSHTVNTGVRATSTVQPQTIKGLVYIVIANSTKTDIQVDIDQIATDLNGKADRDGSNMDASVKNFDGQWVWVGVTVSQATAIGNYTIDLSSYLPNDNYAYECMFAWDITTVANGLTGTVIGSTNAFSYNGIINGGFTNHILTGKTVGFAIWNSPLQSCNVKLIRYRRVGTNQ